MWSDACWPDTRPTASRPRLTASRKSKQLPMGISLSWPVSTADCSLSRISHLTPQEHEPIQRQLDPIRHPSKSPYAHTIVPNATTHKPTKQVARSESLRACRSDANVSLGFRCSSIAVSMPRRRWRVLRMAPMLTSNAPERWNQCHASVVKLNANEPPTTTTATVNRNPFEVTIHRNASSMVNKRRLRCKRSMSLDLVAFGCCVRGSAIVPPIVFSGFDLTEARSSSISSGRNGSILLKNPVSQRQENSKEFFSCLVRKSQINCVVLSRVRLIRR